MELKDIQPYNLDCLMIILKLYKKDIGDGNPDVFIKDELDEYNRIKGIRIDDEGDVIIEIKEV